MLLENKCKKLGQRSAKSGARLISFKLKREYANDWRSGVIGAFKTDSNDSISTKLELRLTSPISVARANPVLEVPSKSITVKILLILSTLSGVIV